MSSKIKGNVSFLCGSCEHPHSFEAESLNFSDDIRPEGEDDEQIRYLSDFRKTCKLCASAMTVVFETWEDPEGGCRYAYYSDVGVKKVQCEFVIEYYSIDEVGDIADNNHPDNEELNIDDENEDYQDHYDHDD